MEVRFYLGEPYLHPQENEAFHYLCCAGAEFMADKGDVRIIGSIGPMDAVVLTHRSITIVDFKDYGGEVQVAEKGQWHTSEGVVVEGGSHSNPFVQVRSYKRRLMWWLEVNRLLPGSNDLSHISGLVIFTKPVSIDSAAMSPQTTKWFAAKDFVDGITFLRHRTSPSLELTSDCMDKIIERLPIQPIALKQSERLVPQSMVEKAKQHAEFKVLMDLEDERMAQWWGKNREWMEEQQRMLDEELFDAEMYDDMRG